MPRVGQRNTLQHAFEEVVRRHFKPTRQSFETKSADLAVLYEGAEVRVETLLAPGQSLQSEATCPSVSSCETTCNNCKSSKLSFCKSNTLNHLVEAHLFSWLFNFVHFQVGPAVQQNLVSALLKC